MSEKTKAEERRTKREPTEGEQEPEVPASRREVRKTYRFYDWASI